MYQPKTGQPCGCRKGVQRDNCPNCEGTGMVIDFKAIRDKPTQKQTHTPGPWQANSTFINNAPNRFMVKKKGWGGEVIADCGEDNDLTEANARLIAAAPELLEAAIYATCPSCQHNRCEGLRRAIAKAEGK